MCHACNVKRVLCLLQSNVSSSCARHSHINNPLHAIRCFCQWASVLQGLLDLVEVIGLKNISTMNLATVVSSMAKLGAAPDARARGTQHHAFALLKATISALQGPQCASSLCLPSAATCMMNVVTELNGIKG